MAKTVPLTEKRIARLIQAGAGRHRDVDGPIKGLTLQTTASHSASWLLRFERSGRERWCGLGPYPLVSLKAARERARDARLKLLDGQDPIEVKRQAKAAQALEAAKTITFEAAARQYFDSHEAKWSRKHREQWLASLNKFAFPIIGKLPVASIDTGLVLKCIEPEWSTKTETMSRTRNRIESVLDWATAREYRTGENPARWRGHLKHLLPARQEIQTSANFAALPYVELPKFLAELRHHEGNPARSLEFLVLTAARTGEALTATWDEFNLSEKLWTIPAARMKSDRQHRVPLSDTVVILLRALPREAGNNFVFIGSRQARLSDSVMHRLLRRLRPGLTVHGFRSTFRDWAAERTSYPSEIAEQALAHQVDSATVRSYKRTDMFDKRRRLMQQWSDYCATTPVETATAGVVVAMRGS